MSVVWGPLSQLVSGPPSRLSDERARVFNAICKAEPLHTFPTHATSPHSFDFGKFLPLPRFIQIHVCPVVILHDPCRIPLRIPLLYRRPFKDPFGIQSRRIPQTGTRGPVLCIRARNLAGGVFDVGFCDGTGDDLRPDAQASHILVILADTREPQVDVVASFAECLFQFDGAGVSDGVGCGADAVAEGEDGSRAWYALLVRRFAGEAVLVVVGRDGAVVDAGDAVVSVVPSAAVANPDNVPFVTVGEDAGAGWAVEGPIYQALGGGGHSLHNLFDAQIPVGVALHDQSRFYIFGDHPRVFVLVSNGFNSSRRRDLLLPSVCVRREAAELADLLIGIV